MCLSYKVAYYCLFFDTLVVYDVVVVILVSGT